MVQDATCNCVPQNIRLLISDVDGLCNAGQIGDRSPHLEGRRQIA